MKFKGTPGPWTVDQKISNTLSIVEIESGSKTICTLAAYEHRYVSIEQVNANAHLIAAAPELLAALQEFSKASTGGDGSFHTSPKEMMECYREALKAITKALGGTESC